MPRTVAPPPSGGDAAPGHRNAETSAAAIDRATAPHDEPAPVPAHPMPVAAARTAATGALIALLAVAAAIAVALTTIAVRSALTGLERVTFGGPSLVLLVVGVALMSAIALVLISRGWATPRPTTLLLTVAATAVWPLSGHALLAAPIAIALIGLALARDRLHPTPARPSLDVVLVLGLGGAVLILAGSITGRVDRSSPVPPGEARYLAPPETDTAPTAADSDATAAADDAGPTSRGGDNDKPGGGDAAADDTSAAAGADATDDATPRGGSPGPAAAGPGDTPAQSAEGFVRGYYADLNQQRFAEAWAKLSPAVQASLGPYARWKAGYGETISSRPHTFSVQGGTVTHLLDARDQGCGRTRRFRVTWQLDHDGDTWAVSRLSAATAGSQEC